MDETLEKIQNSLYLLAKELEALAGELAKLREKAKNLDSEKSADNGDKSTQS